MTSLTWTQAPSGNHGGTLSKHKYLVMHYTASESASASIAWLRTPASKVSAHFVIDQSGHIVQLVDLDKAAWHAGASRYKNDVHLNLCSLGIEFVNPGPLSQLHPGRWACGSRAYTADEVLQSGGRAWALYPDAQIDAGVALAQELQRRYPGIELVGHEEVCDPPGRKQDPGPAFPWARFRS